MKMKIDPFCHYCEMWCDIGFHLEPSNDKEGRIRIQVTKKCPACGRTDEKNGVKVPEKLESSSDNCIEIEFPPK